MSGGIITNYGLDNASYYTTKVDDEQIMFNGHDCSDVMVFAHDTELLFRFLKVNIDGDIIDKSDIIPVDPGAIFGDDRNEWGGIEIVGLSGQKVKFICSWK